MLGGLAAPSDRISQAPDLPHCFLSMTARRQNPQSTRSKPGMPLDIMVRCNPPVAPEVMFLFYRLLANSSDAVILLSGVVATAVLALIVAVISRKLLFSRNDEALEGHSKLAEVVHGSLLAFSVFVLALVLTEVRSNLGKADDLELREASLIARLTRGPRYIGGRECSSSR